MTSVKVMESFCNNGCGEDINVRLATVRGEVHAAYKASSSTDRVAGGISVFCLEKPPPLVRRCGLNLDVSDVLVFVEDKNVVADCRAPLKSDHVSALSQPGRDQELTGEAIQVLLLVRDLCFLRHL